jgi:hypothetical protein
MPYYRILVHGQGIAVPLDDAETAIGFYTIRIISALSNEEAESKAKTQVLSAWSSAEYRALNQGGAPRLRIESVEKISLIRFLLGRRSYGHIYYTKE